MRKLSQSEKSDWIIIGIHHLKTFSIKCFASKLAWRGVSECLFVSIIVMPTRMLYEFYVRKRHMKSAG
ncbi:hypothetical protein D3C78_1672840 [compost metagenome]